MTITYLSTGAFRTRSLAEIFEVCVEIGIRRIELSSGVQYEPDLSHLLQQFQRAGIELLVHNYFPAPEKAFTLNLASQDEQIRSATRDHCRRAIDLTLEVGAPFYSVHSGFVVDLPPNLLGKPEEQASYLSAVSASYDEAYRIFADTVSEIADYAASQGVRLLLENNVVTPSFMARSKKNPFLMTTGEEVASTLKDIAHPAVGLLLDVGHAKVSGNALGFTMEQMLSSVEPFIEAFHLSENDGDYDQNAAFDASAWFMPVVERFGDRPRVIEVYSLTPSAIERQISVL